MIPEITTSIASAKQVFDIAKSVLQLSQDHKVQAAVIDLQSNILDLQSKLRDAGDKYSELAEQKAELQRQLREKENWEQVAERYRLKAFSKNVFGYELRDDKREPGEPAHFLCHPCFHKKKKSILDGSSRNVDYLECHECHFLVKIGSNLDHHF